MKKWVVYLLGVLTGIVLTFGFAIISNSMMGSSDNEVIETEANAEEESNDGVTLFKTPGDVIEGRSFKVMQVVAKNAALVSGKAEDSSLYYGTVCLILNDEGKYYYDEEIIKIPNGKVARQVGIYQYPNRDGMMKTVPIIKIMG